MKNDYFDISGRVAIVTGSGRGIGESIAMFFARLGARVVIADVDEERAGVVADKICTDGHTAIAMKVDVSEEAEVRAMVTKTVAEFGSIDILINNAARGGGGAAPEELPLANWHEVMKVNLDSVFLCCREVGKNMIANSRGAIVNMASVEAIVARAYKDEVAYGASKAAVVHLTRELAKSWAKHNVRVNAIAPCYADTLMGNIAKDQVKMRILKERSPMGRPARVDEFCGPALFLASDASSYVTGHILMVDGGWVIV
jgi:NAD(P)-dependent dehydrogenase (short-subunit alcohol dehydrogenase family)